MALVLPDKPNHGHEVAAIYAFIARSPDGSEGLCGMGEQADALVPMVCTDWEVVKKMLPMLRELKTHSPTYTFIVRKFSDATDIETV